MAYTMGKIEIKTDLKNIPDKGIILILLLIIFIFIINKFLGILKDGSYVILDYYNYDSDYE